MRSAAIMNQAVTDYIGKIALKWQADVCNRLRQIVHQSIPDVEERVQYSKPHFLKNGQYAAVLGTAKGWVSFTIFNAQALDTPAGLFEASDDGSRKTIKIRDGQDVDYELLGTLVRQAASAI
jgi:hypothetical protein